MATQNTKKYSFYDLKAKKKFVPKTYEVKTKNGRRFGVAKNPKTGTECWRALPSKK
jgi:hypothetical protein